MIDEEQGLIELEKYFDICRKSKVSYRAELWSLTEKYFNESVSPLIDNCSLTQYEQAEILYYGYRNLELKYERLNELEDENLLKMFRDNIIINIFSSFYLCTLVASRMNSHINDLNGEVKKKHKEAMNVFYEMNELHQKKKTQCEIYEYKLNNLLGRKPSQKVSSKRGVKPKYNTEVELHKAILQINGWCSLNRTQLAKKLGYKSCSGLNELLKANDWLLPKS